jgi:hypothetical protein
MRVLFILCLGACTTAPVAPKVAAGADPLAYWPLKDGQRLSFDVHSAGGKSERKVRVKKRKNSWFQVGRGQRLRHDGDGLFDGERYLIRRPLVVGASWHAIPRPGVIERFKVVRVDATCPPELAKAKLCLAIEARQNMGDQVLLTRWWYGKNIGLLQVEVFMQSKDGRLRRQSLLRRSRAS